MGNVLIVTTLWSVCPLDIDSQGETDLAFNACTFLFQKALY